MRIGGSENEIVLCNYCLQSILYFDLDFSLFSTRLIIAFYTTYVLYRNLLYD